MVFNVQPVLLIPGVWGGGILRHLRAGSRYFSVAKLNKDGFAILWRYFAWSNQTLALFAFLAIAIWMFENGKKRYAWVPLIPGTFYAFATVTYIMNARIGFNLPWNGAYLIGAAAALTYAAVILWYGNRRAGRMPEHN